MAGRGYLPVGKTNPTWLASPDGISINQKGKGAFGRIPAIRTHLCYRVSRKGGHQTLGIALLCRGPSPPTHERWNSQTMTQMHRHVGLSIVQARREVHPSVMHGTRGSSMIRTHGITHSSSGGSGFGGPGIDPGFGGLKDDGAIPKDDVLLALQEQLQRCTTVNELYHLLASHILCLYKKGQVGRLLIGLVGCPGAGKTTMSKQICNRINEISRCDVCMVLPMDGFHLTKKQLDAFPDPKEAHRRRGSPWTFDGDAFARALYEAKNGNIVRCPSFDHAQGDPVPESILISPACRIVLVEGLYLLLQQEPWTSAARNLHECWFLETELEVALERVKHRQAIDHPDRSTEEITTRVEENDKLNALLVLDTKDKADLLVPDVMHS